MTFNEPEFENLLNQEKINTAHIVENKRRIRAEADADKVYHRLEQERISDRPLKPHEKLFIGCYAIFWVGTFPIAILAFVIGASKAHSHLDTFMPIGVAFCWPIVLKDIIVGKIQNKYKRVKKLFDVSRPI